MTRIFISYRRADSAGYTGRLFDRLADQFGTDNVFMDVTGIEPGLDFVEVLTQSVAACDVLLAMIGPRWLTVADAAGRRRLDNPEDFVRLEISAALQRNIRVIPLLVHGATMPISTELPDDLKPLARRNALTIGTRFHPDVDYLIEVLDKVLNPPSPPSPKQQPTAKPKVVSPKSKIVNPKSKIVLASPFEMEFILIPAGEFLMGSDPAKDKDAQEREQPQHKVTLPDYYIAKYPVTNAQYAAFLKATGYNEAHGNWRGGEKFPMGDKTHPANYVSWDNAVAFCRWMSRENGQTVRLPTEAEWEKAARGPSTSSGQALIYPWGNEFDPAKLNSSAGGAGKTTKVGSYSSDGDSPYGLADMTGNVWEWCSTVWNKKAYPFKVQDEWVEDYLKRTNVPPGCCVGARSTSIAGTCAAPTVSGSMPSAGTAALGFG